MRLAYVTAGLITTTGTANDASGSVTAASIAGYLIRQYAGTAASTVTNGNTQTKTYTCGSGNISESTTDTSGNGFSSAGVGDVSVITFNNCVYGAINANGSITLTTLSITGTPDVNNAQAILQARADYNNLVANSTGTYKINGTKIITIDTLNHVLLDKTDFDNYYTYKSVNGKVSEATTHKGSMTLSSNGSTYALSLLSSNTSFIDGVSMQITTDTTPPLTGAVNFPSNGA